MPDEKDIVWQKIAEQLAEVYRGEYSYCNIIEALIIARDVFVVNLREGIQLKKVVIEEKKDV